MRYKIGYIDSIINLLVVANLSSPSRYQMRDESIEAWINTKRKNKKRYVPRGKAFKRIEERERDASISSCFDLIYAGLVYVSDYDSDEIFDDIIEELQRRRFLMEAEGRWVDLMNNGEGL